MISLPSCLAFRVKTRCSGQMRDTSACMFGACLRLDLGSVEDHLEPLSAQVFLKSPMSEWHLEPCDSSSSFRCFHSIFIINHSRLARRYLSRLMLQRDTESRRRALSDDFYFRCACHRCQTDLEPDSPRASRTADSNDRGVSTGSRSRSKKRRKASSKSRSSR